MNLLLGISTKRHPRFTKYRVYCISYNPVVWLSLEIQPDTFELPIFQAISFLLPSISLLFGQRRFRTKSHILYRAYPSQDNASHHITLLFILREAENLCITI